MKKTRDDEIRLALKEIEFLHKREKAWRTNFRVVRAGNVSAIVNGGASPAYAHLLYLSQRKVAVYDRLTKLREEYSS